MLPVYKKITVRFKDGSTQVYDFQQRATPEEVILARQKIPVSVDIQLNREIIPTDRMVLFKQYLLENFQNIPSRMVQLEYLRVTQAEPTTDDPYFTAYWSQFNQPANILTEGDSWDQMETQEHPLLKTQGSEDSVVNGRDFNAKMLYIADLCYILNVSVEHLYLPNHSPSMAERFHYHETITRRIQAPDWWYVFYDLSVEYYSIEAEINQLTFANHYNMQNARNAFVAQFGNDTPTLATIKQDEEDKTNMQVETLLLLAKKQHYLKFENQQQPPPSFMCSIL